jgi:2,4-dienoyl-CoA reductase-like NADH-dependent reductase (Old Yellow Enzyme family)
MPHANRIDLLSPLEFRRGPGMKNRFMLSPLTNLQSHEDGTLSEEEFHWLTLRARGGFGLTMTCAAHVQEVGKGFPGQLGIWSDRHLEGLGRLSTEIRRHGSLAFVQIHHAGMRSPADLIGGTPVCPSDNEKTGARALSLAETEQLASDFVAAAGRAQTAGFDGVEVHGAHGYIIGQYLSGNINHRTDAYGGSLEGRCRLLFEIVRGIRQICRPDFTIGVRLSPERFGMKLSETTVIAQRLMDSGLNDFLDMSLWDVFKEPEEDAFSVSRSPAASAHPGMPSAHAMPVRTSWRWAGPRSCIMTFRFATAKTANSARQNCRSAGNTCIVRVCPTASWST